MKTQIKRKRYNLISALLLCLLCVFLLSAFPTVAKAETKTVYSDVLEDLGKDELFKTSNYPAKDSGEYSVSVIQIAESSKGELFVYTYEPRRETKELDATSINISTAINDNLKYHNYKLELLNANGVFGKYLVEDFAVLPDALRYYDISVIYRKWDNGIDGEITGGDGSEKSYLVGYMFTAASVNGNVIYSKLETEVIEIRAEDRFDGFVRYSNGFPLWYDKYCDSYFIAFKTDRKIDDLMEADIYWVTKKYHRTFIVAGGNVLTDKIEYDEVSLEEYRRLKAQDEAQNDLTGCLFGRKRYWNRIESVETFCSKEDLTQEVQTALDGKQWVLRFAEYGYERYNLADGVSYDENGTIVSDVTILRLMFETDGVVYNLGVVSDKVTTDTKPDGGDDEKKPGCAGFSFEDLWKYILIGIVAIVVLVLVIAFFPHVVNLAVLLVKLLIKLLFAVFKGLWLIISAPFRGIAALVRKRKDKK